MSAPGPNNNGPSPPLPQRSARLDATPGAAAYLVTGPRGRGPQMLVVLDEARARFRLGYEVRDPVTRGFVEIGNLPVVQEEESSGAFAQQLRGVVEAEKKIKEEKESEREEGEPEGFIDERPRGGNNGPPGGGPGAASGGVAT